MKEIVMFYRDDCGYCDMAFRALEELERVHPEYAEIPFRKVEETQDPDYADKFDYYATPTFYVGEEKIFEAHIGLKYDQMKDEVEKVFILEQAYGTQRLLTRRHGFHEVVRQFSLMVVEIFPNGMLERVNAVVFLRAQANIEEPLLHILNRREYLAMVRKSN